jgi:glycosyltransferase involved in cell wall biosynthesis
VDGIQKGIKACLITPGHIAANPRLVKEAMALTHAGIQVHIIFTQYVEYLIAHDQEILNANPGWTYQSLNWTGSNLLSKLTRVIGGLVRLLPNNNIKINRNFYWQLRKATAYPADIYIAHNPGSMPIAVIAAKKNKVKCGFDAEDFHRYETSNDEHNPDVKLKTAIENANIPLYHYITAASPLIAKRYSSLFKKNVTTILNVFPKTNIAPFKNDAGPVKLFWFSQTIGPNRGLEMVIAAIAKTKQPFELHLLGFIKDEYDVHLTNLFKEHGLPAQNIVFYKPVYADDIFPITAKFDIGLATETGYPINRNICLTNKIFTYIQCGLAVAATNTQAQSEFMAGHPETGKLYKDVNELANILLAYHNDRDLLYETKKASYHTGQTKLNWEIEGEKLINAIKPVLAKAVNG